MSRLISIQEYSKRVKERFPDEDFEVISYTGTGKPVIIKCLTCGKEIKVSKASNFLVKTKAHGCVNCHGLWKEREQKLHTISEKYDILDTNVHDTHTYYHVKCKQCGHERTTSLKNLIKNLDCGCVTGVYRNRSPQEFIDEVNKNSTIGSYSLISEYNNQITKVLLRHDKCGFIWKARPSDVISGKSGCPKCRKSISKGESLIASLLDKRCVKYEMEKSLSNGQRFDFYIEADTRKIAIEYNGIQHYQEVDYFVASLYEQQKRDDRKRQYCLTHSIELEIIPYFWSLEDITHKINDIVDRLNDYPAREQSVSD